MYEWPVGMWGTAQDDIGKVALVTLISIGGSKLWTIVLLSSTPAFSLLNPPFCLLQVLAEVVSTADAAIRRGRLQMHLVAASNGAVYAPTAGYTGGWKRDSYRLTSSGGGRGGGPLLLTSPLLGAVPATMVPEGRVLLAQSARCDATVPPFSAWRTGSLPPYKWVPTLIINVPPAETGLRDMHAMVSVGVGVVAG